jgi:hypothetical protein
MFKDFGRRLQRDVKHIVDGRIANSETASGSHMRVSIRFVQVAVSRTGDPDVTSTPHLFDYRLIVERSRSQRHLTQTTAIRRMVRRKFDGVFARVL